MNKPVLLAWLAVAIPIAALFGPALVSDRSFAFRDAGHFYYPLFEWCCREWAAGRVPLWNPLENAGLPVLADTTSSIFYPGKLLFLLPLDFALRYKLYIILHVALAAAASYWLSRAWKASHSAAALAGIAYACGGSVAFQYCNVVFLVGAAWLPLAALAADRMIQQRSWRSAIALGAVLALIILGGDPQAAFHGLLVAGIYALLMSNNDAPGAAAVPGKSPFAPWLQALLARVALTGLAAIVGFLLAAVQVLPSSEATRYSERAAFNRPRNIYEAVEVATEPPDRRQPRGETRSQSIARGLLASPEEGSHHELAYSFSVGPWRLAEYFWPNIGGRLFPTRRRWFALLPAEMKTWNPTLYLGLLPAVLALSCFRLRKGSARERWLSWLALFFTLASFGWYGIGWLVHEAYGAAGGDVAKLGLGPPVGGVYWLMVTLLPTYAYFRYPAKLLPLVALALSQLAAIGWDRAFAERRPMLARSLWIFGVASGVAAFVVWCGEPWLVIQPGPIDGSLGPYDGRGAYYDMLLALVQGAVVALAGYYCLTKTWAEPERKLQWQAGALLLTAVEVSLANAWIVPTAPASLWRRPSPVAQTIEAMAPPAGDTAKAPPRLSRGDLGRWRPPSFRRQGSPARLVELAQWEHDTLFPKHQLASGVGLIESYGSVKLMDYESLMFVGWQFGSKQPNEQRVKQPTVLRLLGAQFLVLPDASQPKFATRIEPTPDQSGPPWPEDAALWQMNRTLPRAWIVHRVEALPPLQRPLRIEAVDERTKAVLFPDNKARDFLHVAVVETDAPLPQWQDQPDSNNDSGADESCHIAHYDPQRVVVEVELARPGLVVLSDAWFPGWKATVTSDAGINETAIYRTNRVLRGVWLPAGKQTIEFRFQPQSFARGATISIVSWLTVAALGLALLVRRRPRQME